MQTRRTAKEAEGRQQLSMMGRLMPTIMRLRRSNKHHRTRERVRRRLHDLTLHPAPTDPPRRRRAGVRIASHQDRGWTIHTVSPTQSSANGTVLYLHGGGWMNEAVIQHWWLIQELAVEASANVVVPVYPLVQSGGTARTVLPRIAELARSAEGPLILMGDSAGGTIAISTNLMLRNEGPPADLTVLISPALDLRMGNPEIDAVQPSDPWLVKKGQLLLSEMWTEEQFDDPVINPILADPDGIGRLLIFSGTRDILNPDTRLFVQHAKQAGNDVTYHEAPGQLHVYPLLPTPEAKWARREIAEAVRDLVTTHRDSR